MLIVDEAQHLEPELLEEIRLLTNLETSQQKLLQIVLVGQPELDQKMDSPDLRQLKQRIAMRCQLEPLQEEETKELYPAALAAGGCKFACQHYVPTRYDAPACIAIPREFRA